VFWHDLKDIKKRLDSIDEWMVAISDKIIDLSLSYDSILEEHERTGSLCEKSIDKEEEGKVKKKIKRQAK